MSMAAMRSMLLQLRLSLARCGWSNIGALLLCAVGVVGWQWSRQYWHACDMLQQRALVAARQPLQAEHPATPVAGPSLDGDRLAQFYGALGESGYAEQQVKTLFAIAAKTGLSLNRADYKPGTNIAGRFQTYQIVLPVQGVYRSIRAFCEQTLLAIPFASLDQIVFHRDTIGDVTVEARLRFTLYLDAGQSVTAPMRSAMQEGQP